MRAGQKEWMVQASMYRPFVFFVLIWFSFLIPGLSGPALADNFEDTEIRVIRNKYFEKSMRFELSAGISTVMNQSFLYTYLGGLNLGFHFTEQIGVLGEIYLGQTVRKSDCEILGSEFRIDPVVQEIQSYFGGSVDYSPVYGKFQLSSGRVIYFDWFFEAGGGLANVASGGLGCAIGGAGPDEVSIEGNALAIHFTSGQRVFVNEKMSVNWRVRFMNAETVGVVDNKVATSGLFNGASYILLNLGVSYFL